MTAADLHHTRILAQVQVPAIPLTAWEQAGIIIIFGIFILVFLYLIYRIAKEIKPIVSETNKSFQDFIIARDKQWQEYLSDLRRDDREEQRTRDKTFSERNSHVVEALERLAEKLSEHDKCTRSALEEISNGISKPTTRPRPKQ